jgi:hypothetical protein
MMAGEIRILGGTMPKTVQILSAGSPGPQEATPVEVVVHEEVITEDEARKNIRQPGDPEIRVRDAKTGQFEKVKRGET